MREIIPLKVGVVGLSFGSWMIDQMIGHPACRYFQIVAVCDLDHSLVSRVIASHGFQGYDSLDAILRDSNIDVIFLCTGPHGRAAHLRKIIRAGKDVITTKPFEIDACEAKSVLAEALSLKRRIVLNSPGPRLTADLQKICTCIRDYNLGRPIAARADTWCNYREINDDTWRDDAARCPLAPVFRIGIYLINDLVQLFGDASEVTTLQSRIVTQRPTPDNGQLGILFKNGCIANVFASFCIDDGQTYRNSLTLNFERGTIYRNVGFCNSSSRCVINVVTRDSCRSKHIGNFEFNELSGDYQWKEFFDALHRSPNLLAESYNTIVSAVEVIEMMKSATSCE